MNHYGLSEAKILEKMGHLPGILGYYFPRLPLFENMTMKAVLENEDTLCVVWLGHAHSPLVGNWTALWVSNIEGLNALFRILVCSLLLPLRWKRNRETWGG